MSSGAAPQAVRGFIKARVSIYLNFIGKTEEAFTVYKGVFGTEFTAPFQRMGDVPAMLGQPPLSDEESRLPDDWKPAFR